MRKLMSTTMQMICDQNLKILNLNAKFPGARHDSYIWSSAAARKVMQRKFENESQNMFLIGDSVYPLGPWMMTPLTNQPEGSPRFHYNEALCEARNPVERLFGVLKGTWRCLSKQRTLLYDPGHTAKVVNVCTVLHNISLDEQIEVPEEEFSESTTDSIFLAQDAPSSIAKRIQERLIANFFA